MPLPMAFKCESFYDALSTKNHMPVGRWSPAGDLNLCPTPPLLLRLLAFFANVGAVGAQTVVQPLIPVLLPPHAGLL